MLKEKVTELKDKIREFEDENPFADEYSEEIQDLQRDIENDIEKLEIEYGMDYAGDSGLHYGYGWSTTPEDADETYSIYTKYTTKGLVDAFFVNY